MSGGSCKGICVRQVVPRMHSTYMRSNRCMICETWWSPDRRVCGCCGNKLRSKPRFKKAGVQRLKYQRKQLPREIWFVSKSL